jgi:hypothetical protein
MKGILLPGEPASTNGELPRSEVLLFAPVDKRAFGVAIGTVCALAVIVVTVAKLVVAPEGTLDIGLLDQYFKGYSVSWAGAFIGGAWAFIAGFCGGWFTAFIRNLVLALSLFFLRSKAELSDTRDFLDHI